MKALPFFKDFNIVKIFAKSWAKILNNLKIVRWRVRNIHLERFAGLTLLKSEAREIFKNLVEKINGNLGSFVIFHALAELSKKTI